MGRYYEFYDAEHDFKKVASGSFVGMPFFWNKDTMPIEIPMVVDNYYAEYVGLLNRRIATEVQKYMESNNTLFTDLMDKNNTDILVFKVG